MLQREEKKSLRSQQPGAWVQETASHAAEATSAPLPYAPGGCCCSSAAQLGQLAQPATPWPGVAEAANEVAYVSDVSQVKCAGLCFGMMGAECGSEAASCSHLWAGMSAFYVGS